MTCHKGEENFTQQDNVPHLYLLKFKSRQKGNLTPFVYGS